MDDHWTLAENLLSPTKAAAAELQAMIDKGVAIKRYPPAPVPKAKLVRYRNTVHGKVEIWKREDAL